MRVSFPLHRTIGVVGIDATLEEIENILLNDRWGSVYAFLVNEGGETIFHPLLRPSTEVRIQTLLLKLSQVFFFYHFVSSRFWYLLALNGFPFFLFF